MVDMPMRPMEEEREKDSDGGDGGGSAADGGEGGDDRREWKQVVGGFVPKFLRRRMGVEAASASAVDAASADGGGPRRPTILAVDTLEDYKRVVVDERDSIVVVRFHAPWCKSCKSAFPLFSRMASDYRGRSVKFVEVPLTRETAYIHEGLGVPSVPFGHIYHPDAGLVEEGKINRRDFGVFRSALDCYVRGYCDLPPEEEGGEGEGERGDVDSVVVVAEDEFQ